MRLIGSGREVEIVSARDRAVVTKVKGTGEIVTVEPTDIAMSPTEWGRLSNLGGTENLTRWYGYDVATAMVVEVVPGG